MFKVGSNFKLTTVAYAYTVSINYIFKVLKNTLILDLAGSSIPVWLGVVRVGTDSNVASFANIDGTPFDFSYWDTGEPSNTGNREYCVTVSDSYDS